MAQEGALPATSSESESATEAASSRSSKVSEAEKGTRELLHEILWAEQSQLLGSKEEGELNILAPPTKYPRY